MFVYIREMGKGEDGSKSEVLLRMFVYIRERGRGGVGK